MFYGKFQHHIFSGSFREIGKQKGLAYAPSIRAWWREHWAAMDDLGYHRASEEVLDRIFFQQWKQLSRYAPEFGEEMQGIAAGSGQSLRDICLHNLYSQAGYDTTRYNFGCSSVALLRTVEGPVLGQNLDLGGGDYYFIETSRPNEGYATLSDGWMGMVFGDSGINEKGLTVGTSFIKLTPPKSYPDMGFPAHFMVRAVLRSCKNVKEAVAFIRELPPVFPPENGKRFSLIDREGNVAAVDKTREFCEVQWDPQTVMVCTSNVPQTGVFQQMLPKTTPLDEWNYKNSLGRIEFIQQGVRQWDNRATLEDMKTLLRSHQNYGGLCKHPHPLDELGETRLSLIYRIDQLDLFATNGHPCETAYEHFILEAKPQK